MGLSKIGRKIGNFFPSSLLFIFLLFTTIIREMKSWRKTCPKGNVFTSLSRWFVKENIVTHLLFFSLRLLVGPLFDNERYFSQGPWWPQTGITKLSGLPTVGNPSGRPREIYCRSSRMDASKSNHPLTVAIFLRKVLWKFLRMNIWCLPLFSDETPESQLTYVNHKQETFFLGIFFPSHCSPQNQGTEIIDYWWSLTQFWFLSFA